MNHTATLQELTDAWNKHSSPGYGWAMYRFPGSSEVIFTTGKTTTGYLPHLQGSSFVIAPFHSDDNRYRMIEKEFSVTIDPASVSLKDLELPFFYHEEKGTSTPKDHYCGLVSNVLDAISADSLEKAVPARTSHLKKPESYNAFTFYQSLLEAYPNAFVYLLSTPDTGTWIGCTPELLLKTRGNAITTLALAGTRKIDSTSGNSIHDVFTSKELNEQVIVTHYIRAILEKYCDDVQMQGPNLLKAGNVYHLATYFNGLLKKEAVTGYGSLLQDLHPTPAVCGLPLRASKEMLLQQEDFDRDLYSGFLGPVTENSMDLFVNLRCMQVYEKTVQLYAGAGVVTGSDPEKEWQETGEKMNTLLRFL